MDPLLRLWLGLLAVAERVRSGERRPEQELRIRATILWTDRGQSAVEFIGVLALLALLVLALAQSELLSSARRAVTEAVGNLFRPPS